MENHLLIKYPDFRNLFIGRLITSTGDKFFAIALSWWIVSQAFQNGNTILGIVMGSSFLGIVIFGPFTGALADRFSKIKCMMVAMLLSGIVILVMILMFPLFYLFPLMICIFYIVVSSLEPMFTASADGAIAYLVDEEDLPKAVALSEGIFSFSAGLGAALAGLFITLLGVESAFLINALSFFAAAFFVFRIKTRIPVENDINEETYFQLLKGGFTYIKGEKAILELLILFGVANFFIAPIGIGIVLMVSDVYQGTALDVSILEAAMATGAIAVSIIMGSVKVNYDNYKIIFFSFIFTGIPLLIFSISSSISVACIALFCIGITLGSTNISALSIFQHYVSPHMKGRFFSILTTVCFAAIPFGNALMGIFSQQYGIKRVIFVQGIFLLLLSIATLFISRVQLENKEQISREGCV